MPTYSTTQIVCSRKCAIAYTYKLSEKKDKERTKELKAKLETHSDYEEKLQRIVNAIARKIDDRQPCISSGRALGQMHGGHYHSVGSNNSIRFNLHNIHKQCSEQNKWQSGNVKGYEAGILERYGEDYLEYIKFQLPLQYKEVKLSKDELIEATKNARRALRDMEITGDGRSDRGRANLIIGIYK